MKKVTILSLHLGFGGIEQAVISLANNLSSNYNVEIVSIYRLSNDNAHMLDKKVNIKYLMSGDIASRTDIYKKCIKRLKFIELIRALFKDYKFNIFRLIKDTFLSIRNVIDKRRLVKKYLLSTDADIVISTRDFLNKLNGKYTPSNVSKIGWEHNHHNGNRKYFNKICNSVKKLNYFVLVSKDLYKDYDNALKETDCKCVYIPNMIEIPKETKLSKLTENNLINVSRLTQEKGLFDLINVAEKLKEKGFDFSLNLIGDGDLRLKIEDFISQKNLQNYVNVLGYKEKKDVNNYLSESSLYVMTSYTESFGIVLLESFSHGVPAVAFSSAQGANQLIEDGENGYLIDNRNVDEMANKIVELLTDRKKLTKMSKNALHTCEIYTSQNVMPLWIDIMK